MAKYVLLWQAQSCLSLNVPHLGAIVNRALTPNLEARAEYVAGGLEAPGQLQNAHIVARGWEGLVAVDQHAAYKQVFFERLLNGEIGRPLSPLVRVELTVREAELLEPYLGALADLGMVMVYVPAGEFEMGSTGGDDDFAMLLACCAAAWGWLHLRYDGLKRTESQGYHTPALTERRRERETVTSNRTPPCRVPMYWNLPSQLGACSTVCLARRLSHSSLKRRPPLRWVFAHTQ
ncbi:MAG: hypothetical protein KAX24_00420 [Anaerolineae bacterium]|nr:hypothetical protein [Anaerolineae bacterium]